MSLRKNILRGVFVSLVSVIVIIVGVICALNSRWFLNFIVSKMVNPLLPGIQVRKFETTSQNFYFPHQLILEGVQVGLENKRDSYTVDCHYLHGGNNSRMSFPPRLIRLHAEGCNVHANDWSVEGMDLNLWIHLKATGLEQITGEAKISQVRWGPYELNNAKTKITFQDNTVTLKEIFAYLYGGEIQGTISLDHQPGFPYIMDIALKDVDLKRLEDTQNNFLAQVKGRVDGHCSIKGKLDQIESLEGNLDIVEGGQMKAAWLSFIPSQLPPNSVQRKDLEQLIKADGDFPFEKFLVNSKSVTDEKMTSEVKIESKRFNLNLDYTIDTNIEGGLGNFLSHIQVFSK